MDTGLPELTFWLLGNGWGVEKSIGCEVGSPQFVGHLIRTRLKVGL